MGPPTNVLFHSFVFVIRMFFLPFSEFLSFDLVLGVRLHAYTQYSPKSISWADWLGNSVGVGTGVAVLELSRAEIDQICHGDKHGDPATLRFRDPATFRAGEVHNYYHQWQDIIGSSPSAQ